MDEVAVLLVLVSMFLWGTVAARFERADLAAPIVFTLLGASMVGLGLVNPVAAPEILKPLAELALVWVLFSDAARVRIQDLRADLGRYSRLLGIGLPLTILAGWALARWLFPDLDGWLALLVAAALAPTDAALGVPVVTNPLVPARVRRLITVESGLNDGIATPVVMFAIAGAATVEGLEGAGLGTALAQLAIGTIIGVAIGAAGGYLLRLTRRKGWVAEDFAGIAVLALALVAYTLALVVGGNGFVAAFCGGLAFGAVAGRRGPAELVFLEQASALVSLLVWLAFGAIAIPILLDGITPVIVLYAALSLTVVRMVPVALATIGSGLDQKTVWFVGWFGPRGLASLVFALLAVEELGESAAVAVTLIAMTVFLSVIAHGVSAAPLATRYGKAEAAQEPEPEGVVEDLAVRGLPRRHSARPPSDAQRNDRAP
ncbi:cation:proton antiporter [Diaminobutyricimonas sp. TR449]|uniref:cation:proton antiporter n=1 Tax=Diaminobutyricimonas sp. TR449 TaxID=2708076 RepID=UPI00141F2868|nr:cation:proton antiporter [Diaminobutyricimonas sp. TR449]